MSTFQQDISSAFVRLAQAANTLKSYIGPLAALNTTAKSNVVAALNELQSDLVGLPALTTLIDDASTTTNKTWSSSKISTQITTAIAAILGGDTAGDTLQSLADAILAIAQAETGLLSFVGPQTLTTIQKTQGRSNLGAASADDLSTLSTDIGSLSYDFVGLDVIANLSTGL